MPKGSQKIASPRRDGSEVPVGRVAVPKGSQKTASPRRDGSEVPVGRVAVPKGSITTGQASFNARFQTASPRRDGSEAPVDQDAVPKGSQKTASPHRDGSGAPMGRVAVPKGTFLKGFVFTGIEPGYSCELAGVGFDVLLKQLPDFLGGVGAIDPVVGDFRIADSSVDSPVGKFG